MKDEALKQKFINGNRKAFTVVYDRYCDAMYNVCLRYTRNTDEACDILQDAFIKIHQKCDSFNPEYELGGWIKRIVINTAINHIRQNSKIDLVEDFGTFEGTESELENFEVAKTQDLKSELIAILDMLPVGYKTVFNLFVFENLTHQEISNYLNVSENTSKSQLHKAKKMISKILIEKNLIKK
ncbi:MAG: RNA polymerase sigma factor [Crocinitomicaceae bacterium]